MIPPWYVSPMDRPQALVVLTTYGLATVPAPVTFIPVPAVVTPPCHCAPVAPVKPVGPAGP